MREAYDTYEFIQQNIFLLRDLRHLEEALISGGILTPEEAFESTTEELMNNQME